ncbi:MAG: dihydroorotase [Flavobacteriales bacterium]|nr:dihydroorotase [Flavobacteriales bacterium]
MDTLIKKAVIIDPTSPFNGQTKDILISEGIIKEINDDITPATEVDIVEEKGLNVSPGWFDTACCFGEPLYEEAETLQSGAMAAIRGGYTAVALSSPKDSPTDSRQKVEFFISKGKDLPINIYPVGTATQGAEGKAMAESYDMTQGGAIAFADGQQIQNNLIEELVFEYNGAQDYLTITTPMDRAIRHQGVMHEGEVSTTLGLHGIADVAEDVAVARDLFMAQYAKSPLHIACVTTPEAVKMIGDAQKKGVNVSCSVTPHHLLLTDEMLKEFDTRYKVMPPLRTKKHIDALKKAIKNGVVTCIASDHTPIDVEDKKCEYDRAAFGTLGLQTAFGAAWEVLSSVISLEKMICLISINPRERFKVAIPTIEVGGKAEMTMFLPDVQWTFSKDMIESKAKNSAFIGQKLKGMVFAVYNKGELHM